MPRISNLSSFREARFVSCHDDWESDGSSFRNFVEENFRPLADAWSSDRVAEDLKELVCFAISGKGFLSYEIMGARTRTSSRAVAHKPGDLPPNDDAASSSRIRFGRDILTITTLDSQYRLDSRYWAFRVLRQTGVQVARKLGPQTPKATVAGTGPGHPEKWPKAWSLHLDSASLRKKELYVPRAYVSLRLVVSGYPHCIRRC